MRIKLIEAGFPSESLAWKTWMSKDGRFAVPSTGLISLASLVGYEDEVEIIDEKISGPINIENIEGDLVGISYKTMASERAYEIADSLRKRKIPVVLGGIHASLCPQEAAEHCDSVVIGEGEPMWRDIIEDFRKATNKPIYQDTSSPQPIDKLPPPRVDLIKHEKYLCHAVQTSRGCSLDCEFCPTRAMFGDGFRLRNIDAVAREVEELLKIENKPILFVDDVFGAGNHEYIIELTTRLKALSAEYAVICDLEMLNPEILLRLSESGCKMMCINMLSTCTKDEGEAIKKIQSYGINVLLYEMFGFDFNKPDVFHKLIDFVEENKINYVALTILSPYPGTPMGKRLEAEGRIISHDWSLYDQSHVVFNPALMSANDLKDGFNYVLSKIGEKYSFERLIRKIFY